MTFWLGVVVAHPGFPRGRGAIILLNFPQNCMQMEKNWDGGVCVVATMDPPI